MTYYNTTAFVGDNGSSSLLTLAQGAYEVTNGWIGNTIIAIVLIVLILVMLNLGFPMKHTVVSSLWATMMIGIVLFLGGLLSGTIVFALVIGTALGTLWLFIDD